METKRLSESEENEIEEWEWGELEQRLSRLQTLVCELLATNQNLRMALMGQRVESRPGNASTSN